MAMFHVKHAPPEHCDVDVNVSFTNTEIAKDDVQNILDIDSASESAKRRRSPAQFLGDKLLFGRMIARQRPIERRYGVI